MISEVITVGEFPAEIITHARCVRRPPGNPAGRSKIAYIDMLTAFDIETTRIPDIDQSVMYVWQWQFGNLFTVVGRTWSEFQAFTLQLAELLNGRSMVVWVHNLSYEFQFLRGAYQFRAEEVFAVKSRKVLKCSMYSGALEFRCSYLQTNMSLDKFTEKMGVEHRKLSGAFDYTKPRYPWTPLTDDELSYCVHDVRGLVEAMEKQMSMDHDTLYKVPATSTGYVRRDVKNAMRESGATVSLREMLPDYETYKMLREAFRGGNAHANRHYAREIIRDAHSADRSSSYPDVQCNCKFPMGQFVKAGELTTDDVLEMMNKRRKAMLLRVRLWGVKLRRIDWGCPYLSRDKCRKIVKGQYDNGRILTAEYLETTITDIDLRIIMDEYDWDDVEFFDCMYAHYGYLPKPLTDQTREYYSRKTALKGVGGEEAEYYYLKSKNKLNSVY